MDTFRVNTVTWHYCQGRACQHTKNVLFCTLLLWIHWQDTTLLLCNKWQGIPLLQYGPSERKVQWLLLWHDIPVLEWMKLMESTLLLSTTAHRRLLFSPVLLWWDWRNTLLLPAQPATLYTACNTIHSLQHCKQPAILYTACNTVDSLHHCTHRQQHWAAYWTVCTKIPLHIYKWAVIAAQGTTNKVFKRYILRLFLPRFTSELGKLKA